MATAESDVEVTSVEADTIVIDIASMVVVSALVVVASVLVVSIPIVTSVEAEAIVELSTEDSEAKPELVVSNAVNVVDAMVGSPDAGPYSSVYSLLPSQIGSLHKDLGLQTLASAAWKPAKPSTME